MADNKKKSQKIVIEGVTEDGKKFRPSDWADRMSGSLSTFRKRRVVYSPLLRPATKNGNRCVIVDEELEETNPTLYKEILEFAKKNHLKIDKHESDEDAE